MSERWWRRRKRLNPWFSAFYKESNRLENIADELASRRAFEASSGKKKREPHLFEFSFDIDRDENPRFRRFGNSRSNHYESLIREHYEPLVDVLEEDAEVVVVAELPGMKKEDIQIRADNCTVTISVNTFERKYFKELVLPAKADPESARATYKNGVLQVRLKKLVEARFFQR